MSGDIFCLPFWPSVRRLGPHLVMLDSLKQNDPEKKIVAKIVRKRTKLYKFDNNMLLVKLPEKVF